MGYVGVAQLPFFFIGCFVCYWNDTEKALNAEVLENP